MHLPNWPERIETEDQLEEVLTRPSPALVKFIPALASPLLILGAGGKMGPSLAMLAKRAAQAANLPLEIITVSRFSDPAKRAWLENHGIKTLPCDLLSAPDLQKLPETKNIVYLVGLKFGTAQDPAATWAVNSVVPVHICERYPKARTVALSTGNVYPLSEIARGGSQETDPLTPLGEYANAAVGRERIFEFYSRCNKTQLALLRLFYAVELRYGVPVDIARKVYGNEPIDVANGYFNCIWQGDANEMILRALALADSPASVWNLCRPETFSVREVAAQLSEVLGRSPQLHGAESKTALLGNAARICKKLGPPSVSLERMLTWIAHWVEQGGRDLGKPTHFEVRDGKY